MFIWNCEDLIKKEQQLMTNALIFIVCSMRSQWEIPLLLILHLKNKKYNYFKTKKIPLDSRYNYSAFARCSVLCKQMHLTNSGNFVCSFIIILNLERPVFGDTNRTFLLNPLGNSDAKSSTK